MKEDLMAKKESSKEDEKFHPWRVCPYGEHWVEEHPLRVPPSEKNPLGYMTVRRAHCAKNPTGRDQLYTDEIHQIRNIHFTKIDKNLCTIQDFKEIGNAYDDLIIGWTQYWNEILKPSEPLDPKLVKALIASESSFNPTVLANSKNSNSARGLLQLTNATRKILGDENGELKDHLITVTRSDLSDPNINICSGVRWLFQKRYIASKKLKRDASWEEAVFEYKGLSKAKSEDKKRDILNSFLRYYKELKVCKK
jgi:hypothetical protein